MLGNARFDHACDLFPQADEIGVCARLGLDPAFILLVTEQFESFKAFVDGGLRTIPQCVRICADSQRGVSCCVGQT